MAGNPLKLGHPATYEDLEALPDNVVGEILGGELYATPRPAFPHALTATVLTADLGPHKVRAEPFDDVEFDLAHWWPPLTDPEGETP